jgi:hypothetical protein
MLIFEPIQAAAETILTRIQPDASRLSYSFENWLFHYISDKDVVYLCAADGEMGRRLPFAFLSEVQKKVRHLHHIKQDCVILPFPLSPHLVYLDIRRCAARRCSAF